MIILRSPSTYIPEREYIYQLIINKFLGQPLTVIYEERIDIVITTQDHVVGKLVIADVLLQKIEVDWLQSHSLPSEPLMKFAYRGHNLPIIYGSKNKNGHYYEHDNSMIYCGIDIFGSALFMLTRYEECVITERDSLDRFSAYRSLAFREGFLHRPIINEYIELLWESILILWPQARREQRKGRQLISHDVDWPYYVFGKKNINIYKEVISDVIKRMDIESGFKKAKGFIHTRGGDLSKDPFNTFKWVMDLSERVGIQSSFYFITEETERGVDGNYHINDPEIQKLLREIHHRGHEIGLHPSYHTYLHPERIKHQFEALLQVTDANGIYQSEWGGRQHYLRWRAPETWQYWEEAGLSYDSSLSYADVSGFRCGICYEYPVYNLRTRKQLKLRERPLIVMEQTLLHSQYMGLKKEQALSTIQQYKELCRRFNGDFTLLWHNSQLVKSKDADLYQKSLNI